MAVRKCFMCDGAVIEGTEAAEVGTGWCPSCWDAIPVYQAIWRAERDRVREVPA